MTSTANVERVGRVDRRSQLVDATIKVISERGYAETRVADIAAAVERHGLQAVRMTDPADEVAADMAKVWPADGGGWVRSGDRARVSGYVAAVADVLREHLARAGIDRGVLDGPFFDLGNARRYAHHHPRAREQYEAFLVYFFNEVFEHLLGNFKVAHHPVHQGSGGNYVGGGFPYHALGVVPDREYLTVLGVNRNHRGFVDNYSLAAHIHQSIGRA